MGIGKVGLIINSIFIFILSLFSGFFFSWEYFILLEMLFILGLILSLIYLKNDKMEKGTFKRLWTINKLTLIILIAGLCFTIITWGPEGSRVFIPALFIAGLLELVYIILIIIGYFKYKKLQTK